MSKKRTKGSRKQKESLVSETETPRAVEELRSKQRPDLKKSVAIIGAGMAGLCAAYELEKLGFEVTVLEADKKHIGGRVRTFRRDGCHGELGAMRIPKDHNLTRFYIRECGLALRPFVQENEDAWVFIRGKLTRKSTDQEIFDQFDLTSEERKLTKSKIWDDTVGETYRILTKLERRDMHRVPQTDRIKKLDRLSLYALLTQGNLSSEALQLMASSWGLESSLHSAALESLRDSDHGTWLKPFSELEGGMDTLPRSLSKLLKTKVRRGCVVESVDQLGKVTTLTYKSKQGAQEQLQADWVICTVPLGVLSRISFSPPLSAKKQDAIRRVSYDSAAKVLAVSRNRFWELEDGIYGGGSVSDHGLGSIWYPSDNTSRDPARSKERAIFLASYTWGQQARRASLLLDKETVIKKLAIIHRSLEKEPGLIEKTIRWDWDKFVWSNGAYASFKPGDQTELYPHLLKPEGRLVLAGEHASLTHAWIQGAIESGLRAAFQVVCGHNYREESFPGC